MSDKTPLGDNGDKYLRGTGWKKSTYSMSNGQCLETSQFADGQIGVRDSKAVGQGPMLRFTPGAWTAFVSTVRTV